MSEMVPEGWVSCTLGDTLKKIEGGGTPSRTNPEFWGGEIPWATVKDLTAVRLNGASEKISEAGLLNSSAKLIPSGTIVIATRMAVGKASIFSRDVAINQDLKALNTSESITSDFLLQWYLANSQKIESLGTGSTVKGITLDTLSALPFDLPPLPEQKKIAAILTSVDDVIESTQKQIDKLQDLKKATMNELLTKGIGHTEFKDSELGRIPKSWEVKALGDTEIFVIDGDRGRNYPKESDFFDSGYCLFLSAKNVTKNGFSFKSNVFIGREKDLALSKGKLLRDDIVITTRGTVGNIAHFDASIRISNIRINSGMALIRNRDERFFSKFIYNVLSSQMIGAQVKSLTFGSAQPQLTVGTIKDFLLPLPPIDEQREIVRVFSSVAEKMEQVRQKLTHLQSLKKSLMQDLLTGKVRVKVD